LWRSWDYKEQAAEALKLTAQHMHRFKLIDGIIKEPLGGAHANPDKMAATLKKTILKEIKPLEEMDTDERIDERVEKFADMGKVKEKPARKSRSRKTGSTTSRKTSSPNK
jgi:acetyl-CoA carboxylase carboxyl transferase subunit alpha